MKRIVLFLLIVVMLLSTISNVFGADREIKVSVDGQHVNFDVSPVVLNGRTLVPMRAIFEKIGFNVEWIGSEQKIKAKKDNISITMQIGSYKANINNKTVSLDTCPAIIGGRTMVPLRFVGEGSNHDVLWDGDSRSVIIESRGNDYAVCEQQIFTNVTASNEWTFFSDDRKGMYKFKADFSQVTKVLSSGTNTMQAVGDSLYGRLVGGGDLKYCRLDTNTNKLQRLTDNNVTNCVILDNWVYYSLLKGVGLPREFYKMKLDGSEKTKLLDAAIGGYCIIGNYIYYEDALNQKLIKKSLTNNEDSEVICNDFVTSLAVYKNEIYFSTGEYIDERHPLTYKGIFKYNPVDRSIKLISSSGTEHLKVINDCIYYTTPKTFPDYNGSSLFRMKIDGSYNIKLLDGVLEEISVVGNYIYYCPFTKTSESYIEKYRVRTDGSNKQRLSDFLK